MDRSRGFVAIVLCIPIMAIGCTDEPDGGSDAVTRSVEEWKAVLPAVETFTWDDQPIEFRPPPADWERQREQSGGLMGARFVKYEFGGQAIHVAEVTSVGRRDRCSELESLLRDADDLSSREFQSRLQRARPYLHEPINRSEEEAFEAAIERLDDARSAYRQGDLDEVRSRISAALWDLRWVDYALDEVVGPAMFTGAGYEQFGSVEISEPIASSVGSESALVLDYSVDLRPPEERTLRGRKVYVAHNNRLFEASFQGVAEYLPLFDAIVESINFPEGPCEH